MKAEDMLGFVLIIDRDIASLPETVPPLDVATQERVETANMDDRLLSLKPAFGNPAIAGGVECHDLFDRQRGSLFHVNGTLLSNEARFFDNASFHRERLGLAKELGSGSLCDLKLGLVGLDLQINAVVTHRRGFQKFEVLVVERPVALDAGIDHASVER